MNLGDAKSLVMLPTSALKPPVVNPNVMDPDEVAALKASILAGKDLPQPLVVGPVEADGLREIIDGEHRWAVVMEIAAAANTVASVPCIIRDWSEDRRAAYRLALNKNRGRVRLAVARQVVESLRQDGWSDTDLVLTGYSPEQLKLLEAPTVKPASVARNALLDASDEDEAAPVGAAKPFVLEVFFASAAELKSAKRLLRKAAGRTKNLTVGLKAVLGME